MAKLCLKKKSKRISARLRYKIDKKVRDHNRKVRKEAKKQPKSHKPKVVRVPQDCPFRDDILKEVEDLKRKKEEEKLKQRALWKEEREKLKRLEKEAGGLEGLVASAEMKQKVHEAFEPKDDEKPFLIKKEGSLKAYYREFKKVVQAADIILEVVDARDPIGTRCKQVEEAVQETGGKKRLVIVINKADLIPRDILDKWLKYLRGSFPTVPFKASTQSQRGRLGRKTLSKSKHRKAQQNIKVSSCVGAELLMSLLGNYCRNKNIKTAITVGVVGLPNVGKSSIINSLKRNRACNVGATPGVTRLMQEIQLDSKIKLLDSPGLVFAKEAGSETDAVVSLRNAVKVEAIADPFVPATAILQRVTKDQMMQQYAIGDYDTPEEFFATKAKRQGKYKKGGVVDLEAAARGLIEDWNRGRIRYYTEPPAQKECHISSVIVDKMAKEFDFKALERMEVEMMNELESEAAKGPLSMLETTGIVEAMDQDQNPNENIKVVGKENRKRKHTETKQDKEEANLVPASSKKLQKALAKKRRKESNRREKETTNLAGVLEKISMDNDDYNFEEAFSMS
ncbi:unnamed protein product [Nezara viridula]|uniref:Guanine nucleotide-binding protein-like 3 homolog n=1 Tax=Nezara viridula TaxID=85310 RepID=A0A9P0MV00_NEZVI|nr:unnamed protein product [Nezara viridula]